MIIDVHTHICFREARLDREAFLSPLEVAFSSIYRDPKARLAGASELVDMLDEEGLDMAVTFGFPWSTQETAQRQNDYLLEAQARFPDRLIGLACFDPLAPWALREAERALEAGLKGLGELAIYDAGFNAEAISRLAELGNLCRDKGLPLMVHVNEPIGHQYPGKAPLTLKMIYDLILALKGVKLILAHWGGGVFFYHLLKKQVAENLTDVYFDTAASPFLYRPQIYDLAVKILGPEKILMGSDYPLLKPGRYYQEMTKTELSPEALEMIKGKAAQTLLMRGGYPQLNQP